MEKHDVELMAQTFARTMEAMPKGVHGFCILVDEKGRVSLLGTAQVDKAVARVLRAVADNIESGRGRTEEYVLPDAS